MDNPRQHLRVRHALRVSWPAVARRQAGHITRAQLLAAGVAARTIDFWLSIGRLEATRAQGVYRTAGSADNEYCAAWFAVLATRSPLSFGSASEWWEMPPCSDGLVHITRFDRRRLDWPKGIRVHRVALSPAEVVEHRGLLVTSRAVTALDCAGTLPRGRALTYADRAIQQRWLTPADIRDRVENAPGRWGNRQLRWLSTVLERGAEAESERILHRLLRAANVRGWVPQQHVLTPAGGFRVDVSFPALRLAIEVDGYAYHSGDRRFQNDRTKQNALLAAGWRVLRFTWEDLIDRPAYVIAQVTSLLAA